MPAPTRKVSLFTIEGKFFRYVHVRENPRVVLWAGKTYVCADATTKTWTFREAPYEQGHA